MLLSDDEELHLIEERCKNWCRCLKDISPAGKSALADVLEMLKREKGYVDEEQEQGGYVNKDILDAEKLETVWRCLTNDQDNSLWQEKLIIRYAVFFSSMSINKMCKLCHCKQREWNRKYRKAMLIFASRVRVMDYCKEK